MLDRMLGSADEPDDASAPDTDPDPDPEVADIRKAAAAMGTLPAEQRRFLAGYAYVLVRVARADGVINDAEMASVEGAVIEAGELEERQGVLLVALASRMNLLYGATEDYAFTRELARMSSPQRLQRLLRACVSVAVADGDITAAEMAELHEIGRELRFRADEIDAIREQIGPSASREPGADD